MKRNWRRDSDTSGYFLILLKKGTIYNFYAYNFLSTTTEIDNIYIWKKGYLYRKVQLAECDNIALYHNIRFQEQPRIQQKTLKKCGRNNKLQHYNYKTPQQSNPHQERIISPSVGTVPFLVRKTKIVKK